MLTKEDLEKKYGSDWELETLDRLLGLDTPDPHGEKLWDTIERLLETRDGIRDQTDMLVKQGRELTSAEEASLIETIDELMTLLDRAAG